MKSSAIFNNGSIGNLPTKQHSASLEEKLNEISLRHSDSLSRRISELSRSVQDQLTVMNENLHKQEENIKKSIKKSQFERKSANIPIPSPPQPPRHSTSSADKYFNPSDY